MKKIALIMEHWGKGGTESYVEGLIKKLNEHRFDISLVLLKSDQEFNIDCLSSDKIHVVKVKYLASFLKNSDYDVVNLHLYSTLLPITLISKYLRFQVTTTLHMPVNSWGLKNRYKWKLATLLANQVVCVSTLIKNQISSKNLYPEIMPGGIDDEFLNVKYRRIENLFSIAAIGRLSKEKNWETLIDAVSLLPPDIRENIVIEFYGEGDLSIDLDRYACNKSVNVKFHGFIAKHELIQLISSSYILVLPSQFEGFGLAAVEGMAAGIPTITSNYAASEMYIDHNNTGHTFTIGNDVELASLIEWHISNPGESYDIGQRGKKFVSENFTNNQSYNGYLKIFN